MKITAIDHVLIAIPPGSEQAGRDFYGSILGFSELPKPAELIGRGGVWFTQGKVTIHLGVEKDFRPAKKAHPAFLVEGLDELIERCKQAGVKVSTDEPSLHGYIRVHVYDPYGNRLELMEAVE
ncbi:MAG TPA: VOC family protein [Anaerolineales bacterium]|nr:VOC family protein [Anaerolineales bacterium]